MTPAFMIPPICSETGGDLACNHLAGALEISAFCDTPPEYLFAYVNAASGTLTTFMGGVLGRIEFGRKFESNLGDQRQSIKVRAINGRTYHGTYYRSAGDYARLRLVAKGRP